MNPEREARNMVALCGYYAASARAAALRARAAVWDLRARLALGTVSRIEREAAAARISAPRTAAKAYRDLAADCVREVLS